jgi:hypothetical protein
VAPSAYPSFRTGAGGRPLGNSASKWASISGSLCRWHGFMWSCWPMDTGYPIVPGPERRIVGTVQPRKPFDARRDLGDRPPTIMSPEDFASDPIEPDAVRRDTLRRERCGTPLRMAVVALPTRSGKASRACLFPARRPDPCPAPAGVPRSLLLSSGSAKSSPKLARSLQPTIFRVGSMFAFLSPRSLEPSSQIGNWRRCLRRYGFTSFWNAIRPPQLELVKVKSSPRALSSARTARKEV